MKQIILLIETTGKKIHDATHDEDHPNHIVELVAIENDNGVLTEKIHFYFNPGIGFTETAANLNKLDEKNLSHHRNFQRFLTIEKQKQKNKKENLFDLMKDAEVVVQYKPFILSFLNDALSSLKMPLLDELCSKLTDTHEMSKFLYPKEQSHGLDAIAMRTGLLKEARKDRNGERDAKLLANVFLKLCAEEKKQKESLLTNNYTAAMYKPAKKRKTAPVSEESSNQYKQHLRPRKPNATNYS